MESICSRCLLHERAVALEFKDIKLRDKAIIESFTKPWNCECSDLSFANLFIWGANGKIQYAVNADVLYIKLNFEGVPQFMWPPVPKYGTSFSYKEIVKIAMDHIEKLGFEPTIRNVCEPFKKMAQEQCPSLIVTPQENAFDYVYARESLETLRGKKLHGKRNHINKFMLDFPDFEYKRLDEAMVPECIEVYKTWNAEKTSEDDIDEKELENEKKSVMLALKNMKALGLVGGVIRIEGEIKAFCVGEKLRHDMQLVHIEKADHTVNGLYTIINQQYVLNECQNVSFINREEDMGVPGMRQAKRSYQPVKMVEKFMFSKRLLSPEEAWNN